MAIVDGSAEALVPAETGTDIAALQELDFQLQLIADRHIAAIDEKAREFMQTSHRSMYYTYSERIAFDNPEDRFTVIPFPDDEVAIIKTLAGEVSGRIEGSLKERNFGVTVTTPAEQEPGSTRILTPRLHTTSFFVSW